MVVINLLIFHPLLKESMVVLKVFLSICRLGVEVGCVITMKAFYLNCSVCFRLIIFQQNHRVFMCLLHPF